MKKDPGQVQGEEGAIVDEMAYEQLVDHLDGVVRQLEAGELTLEDSLRAFERGVKLAQAAEQRLDAAEQRVEVLLQGDRVQPLPAGEVEVAPQAPRSSPPPDDDIPF